MKETKAPEDGDELKKEMMTGTWTEYQDEEGRTYYYNDQTQESTWDLPEGVVAQQPVPMEDASGPSDDVRNDRSKSVDDSVSNWTRYQDDDGQDYYYNHDTGVTQWDMPDGFIEDGANEEFDEKDDDIITKDEQGQVIHDDRIPDVNQTVDTTATTTRSSTSTKTTLTTETIVKEEGESEMRKHSPTDQTNETEEQFIEQEDVLEHEPQDSMTIAQNALDQPDSVLELNAVDHVFTLVEQKDPNEIMKSLVTSYQGTTAMCGVLSRWLLQLKNANDVSSSSSVSSGSGIKSSTTASINRVGATDIQKANADVIRNIITQEMERLAKINFTDAAQQQILNLTRKERMFFEEMMEHAQWRKLLIDLSSDHKDSALLTYCLQTISKKGYHREIAKRINQSDYFNVFHGMLISELSLIGKISVNQGKMSDNTDGADMEDDNVETIVHSLKKQSTSTGYTFIYVMEMLDELIRRAKTKMKSIDEAEAKGLTSAIQKWQRIREEVQRDMIKPSMVDLNPLTKKRRADIAVISSDLYQNQRRKLRLSNSLSASETSEGIKYSIDTGIVNMLKKFCMGTNLDEDLLNQLLYNPNKNPNLSEVENIVLIGEKLYSQPLVLEYLLKSLFVPSCRVKTNEMKMKCSKLIAMATLAAQRDVKMISSNEYDGEDHHDANDLKDQLDDQAKTILLGSQLCQQLENVVKFIVTDDETEVGSSVGSKLSALCIKNVTVSQGFLLWAIEKSKNNEFPTSAAYPYTGPGLLSLSRIITKYHPLLRDLAIQVASQFLSHSNSELSYQKLNAIKEQVLRLFLIILSKGMATDVITIMTKKLKEGVLDAGLVRYFVGGCIDIMNGPFSPSIVSAMGEFLIDKSCVDILNAVYFDVTKKRALRSMIQEFATTMAKGNKLHTRTTKDDRALINGLKEAYAFSSVI
jgi:hypothetical protein